MPTRASRRNRQKPPLQQQKKLGRNEDGNSALLAAIEDGDDVDEMMRLITPQSANIPNRYTGRSALMAVLECIPSPYNICLIRRLIEDGADVNAVNDEGAAVIFHVDKTDKVAYRMLMAAGACIDTESVQCPCHHTLLIGAVQANDVEYVKLLIQLGANVNHKNEHGLPLEQAIKQEFTEVANVLRQHNAVLSI
jgi:uncharacterized protein